MASKRRKNGLNADEDGLDEIDIRLLAELQADARLRVAELGRRVGLSPPAVAERLQRLERDGVVRGYRAEVDPRSLGYTLTAIIRLRPAPGQLRAVAELAQATPEIAECHRVTGDDCYVATAHVRDVGHLETLIDRFALLGQTTTSIVQSSPVTRRGPALRADRRRHQGSESRAVDGVSGGIEAYEVLMSLEQAHPVETQVLGQVGSRR